jgi:hypothetical protein
MKWGFLYIEYKSDAFYWELIKMYVKVIDNLYLI